MQLETYKKQQEILIEILEDIFLTIHPSEKNFDCYGHQIRNLLILAATEVESAFTAILEANSIFPLSSFYSTRDYVRLQNHLRLEEYQVELSQYPWLPKFNPFCGWNTSSPTQSLFWYDAYNKVKHNRERNFEDAKLQYVINSVVAVHILLVCQFGEYGGYDRYFKLAEEPIWPREELYIPPNEATGWKEVNLKL